ncbi:MAG: NAD-dependent epimerase/dehydratase family protein [Betaproteobacteria bacterium]|nr:NAD-dependent epimerase/dehydratase family protein [Betaproteobacteria bacterium]
MRVLITGGGGFLGRRIVRLAQKAGYETLAPGRGECDLENAESTQKYFSQQKPDAAVHSAAHYGGIGICAAEPLFLAARNLRMAANVFESAAASGAKKIVSVGSTCAYPGNIPESGMLETEIFSGRCHESVEAYGFSKRAHLVLMAAAHKQFGISCGQIALTNLYGEDDVFGEYRAHAIAALIKKIADAKLSGGEVIAWGTGAPVRQFAHVEDAAEIIVRALKLPHDDWPVNVGGAAVSIRDLANGIADIAELPREKIKWDSTKPDGVMRKVADDSKLRRLFPDYKPTPFWEGLKKTVRWYLANKKAADARK